MTPHASPRRSAFVLLLVVLALLPQGAFANRAADIPAQPLYAPGEVVIGWMPGAGPVAAVSRQADRPGPDSESPAWQAANAQISRETGLTVLSARPDYGFARLAVKAGSEGAQIARLESLPWVRYAEPNYLAHAAALPADVAASPWYPNDPDFVKQWNMQRVRAPQAWAATRGSATFIVAVLDTGVAQNHPDFAGQLLQGENYVDPSQQGAEDDDVLSHGTHVTGIIAARTNNGTGVAGLAPDIKILPLKVLNEVESGRYDAIGAAIRDAADRQAQVINMSMTGPHSTLLQDAIIYAQSRGALVVAAAGNCAQNPGYCGGQTNPDLYPAGYPGVVAVAASDRFDHVASYSGYKPYIALAAPGGTDVDAIWSTANPNTDPGHAYYKYMYGTSMSTPMVSAAAALVWTLRPAATGQEIVDILKSTADKVGTYPNSDEPLSYASGRNDYFGSGRLNVENAVRWAYPPAISVTEQVKLLLGGARTSATQALPITNPSGQGVYWQATVTSGAPWLTLTGTTGTSLYDAPAQVTFRADRGTLTPGVYVGTIHVQPVYPAGVSAVDIRVELRVAAKLGQTYLPAINPNPAAGWLDPDAPNSLRRSILPLANDRLIAVDSTFPIQFYGASYQTMQVSDNGMVLFGANAATPVKAPAYCPGDGRQPNNAVYVLGYDWDPALGGRIIAHQPDAETFVVTWQGVRRAGSALAQSFQVVMKNDGLMRANYQTVEAPLPGIIATENFDGALSQSVLCNGAGRQVKSGESVSLAARLPW